jgi:hypothetical protein
MSFALSHPSLLRELNDRGYRVPKPTRQSVRPCNTTVYGLIIILYASLERMRAFYKLLRKEVPHAHGSKTVPAPPCRR